MKFADFKPGHYRTNRYYPRKSWYYYRGVPYAMKVHCGYSSPINWKMFYDTTFYERH